MENKPKEFSVNYLYVAAFTLITITLWIGFEIFRSLTTPSKVPQVTQEELKPLSGELDLQTMTNLKERDHVSQEILNTIEVKQPLIGPEVIELEAAMTPATESATIKPAAEKEATASGGI